jgi:hypothetical protein
VTASRALEKLAARIHNHADASISWKDLSETSRESWRQEARESLLEYDRNLVEGAAKTQDAAVWRLARELWLEGGYPSQREDLARLWDEAPGEVKEVWLERARRYVRAYEGWKTPYPLTRSPADMLQWVLDHLVRPVKHQGRSRWTFVMEFCGLGSTSATALCRWLGQDPDERVSAVKHPTFRR